MGIFSEKLCQVAHERVRRELQKQGAGNDVRAIANLTEQQVEWWAERFIDFFTSGEPDGFYDWKKRLEQLEQK